ncbi:MAG: polyprenyl synthetase family protein [Burkholderiales bacterium]|nr:polyprenyl synthetase family protein [Burkholderiales bacterium]
METNRTDFAGWMQARQRDIEAVLEAILPDPGRSPARLHEAMRYAVLGGGKRVRPLLAYAAGEAARAERARVDRVAAAVELVHAYSLVHDDLPCMDDDVLRRGRPTCHVAYDEATALLAGDALQSLAFDVLAGQALCVNPAEQVEMIALLACAIGSRGMAGGQAIDLASTGQELSLPELENMHIHKTGELIRASVVLGARCGDCDGGSAAALDRFARCAGLAFQVVDDVLDAESDSETLGKTAGKDARQNKATYVSIMGAAQARRFAEDLRVDALQALLPFGAEAARLRELIDFIVLRRH